ncbi:MAG: hypothetical protein FJY88_02565 [Candidatus Eisenbacteria bacterium]|nr:hypothetical protein [Candidatus Eisenbacteria bacterium]
MAQQSEVVVTVDGKSAEDLGVRFNAIELDQYLNEQHRFSIACAALDESEIGVYGSPTLDALIDLIGKPVKIEVFTPDRKKPRRQLSFTGLLLDVTSRRVTAGGYTVILSGSDPTMVMDRFPRKRIWESVGLQSVVNDIVKADYGLDITIEGGEDEELPIVFQYNESDFDFLARLAERRKLFFFYDGASLFWTEAIDSSKACPTIDLTLESSQEENLLSVFQLTSSVAQGKHKLRTYNEERDEPYVRGTDEVQISGKLHPWLEAARNAAGSIYPNPGHGCPDPMMRSLAEMRGYVGNLYLSHLATRVSGSGETENCSIRPPALINIQGVSPDQNGTYLVTEVHHTMDAAQGHYRNRIGFLPLSAAYPAWVRPWPSAGTLLTGIVVDAYDQQKPGMVRVRLNDWVDGATQKGQSKDGDVITPWIRILMPYGGKGHGIVFVPEIGDEVLIGFERGDPERPIVLGSLYTEFKSDAFGKINPDIPKNEGRVILTKGGHVVRFSDKSGSETIEISTPDAKSSITMIAGKLIDVKTTGDITISADGNITMTAQKKVTIEAIKGIEMQGHPEIKGAADAIALESKTYKSTQSEKVEITCNKAIEVTGGESVKIEGTKKLEVGANQGTASASAMQGVSVGSQTADVTVSGMTEAKLTSGASVVKASPAGVDVMGPIVKIN